MGLKFSTCMKLSRTAFLFNSSKLLLKSFKKVFNLDNDALSVHSINIFSKKYQFKKKKGFVREKQQHFLNFFMLLILSVSLSYHPGMECNEFSSIFSIILLMDLFLCFLCYHLLPPPHFITLILHLFFITSLLTS